MITLVLIGFLSFLFFVYHKIKFSYWERRGIKGPRPLPIFGTILNELSLPPKEIEELYLSKYGHVFGTYFGTVPILNTSDPDHIKTVLSDLKTFPNDISKMINLEDKYLSHSMLFKSNNDWKQTRAIQTHYFTSKKLRNLVDHFEVIVGNFITNIETLRKEKNSNELEIKQLAKCYGLDVIAKVLFAIDCNSFQNRFDSSFVKYAMHIGDINFFQTLLITILPKKLIKLLRLSTLQIEPINNLGNFFEQLLQQRKDSNINYNDLSSLLEDARINKQVNLSKDEVIANILAAFFAGIESVSNAIANGLYFLSENVQVQKKLQKVIANEFNNQIDYEKLTQNQYLDAVIQEILRLGSQNINLNRTASKDTKLGDLKIEKGTEVRLILHIIHTSDDGSNLDPKSFNPDRFLCDIDESKKKSSLFIPFGLGNKKCLGERLALIEMKYLFVRLLQKYNISRAKETGLKRQNFRGFSIIDKVTIKFDDICNRFFNGHCKLIKKNF